jgi:fructose-1,6-bisphosphatase/inositol monophosphatase family enzyme
MPSAPSHLFDTLPTLLREAADTHIVPRFKRLQRNEIEEKSPGEWVTVVDREVEAMLAPALRALQPGSRVVGEEACATDPGLLQGLDSGWVWLIDPLDGTSNFIAGDERIGILVALMRDGEPVASWMLDPLSSRLHVAERGAGAWCNGERLQCPHDPVSDDALRGIVKTKFLPPDVKPRVLERARRLREQGAGANCAANDYPDVVAGRFDFVLYWRTLPWDHLPGALLLEEAGGRVARLDGSAYRAADDRAGLLVARGAPTWEQAHALLWA